MYRSGVGPEGEVGYDPMMDYYSDSNGKMPSARSEWLKRNWLMLILIALGLAGILISMLNFFVPCELTTRLIPVDVTVFYNETVVSNVTTFENVTRVDRQVINVTTSLLQPLRIVAAVDGSGSVGLEGFKTEVISSATFLGILGAPYTGANITNPVGNNSFMDYSVMQWSNVGEQTLIGIERFDLDNTVDKVNSLVDTTASTIYLRKGTSFSEAQAGCYRQLKSAGEKDAAMGGFFNLPPMKQICMIVSDGNNNDPATAAFDSNGNVGSFCTGATNSKQTMNGNVISNTESCQDGLNNLSQFCATEGINPCTKTQVNNFIKSKGIIVSGIYIGNADTAKDHMLEVSSCDVSETFDTCPLLANVANVNGLEQRAREFATTLLATVSFNETVTTIFNDTITVSEEQVTQVSNRTIERVNVTETFIPEEICTDSGFWFFFLTMFIPLGLYMFWRPISLFLSKYCCKPKPKKTFKAQPMPVIHPPLQEEALVMVPTASPSFPSRVPTIPVKKVPTMNVLPPPIEVNQPPAPEPNALKKSKRYKWSIKAADAYLWNLGASGVAPLQVNFNGAAPPSAPKQEAKEENMNRRTQRISLRWSYIPERDSRAVTKGFQPAAEPHFSARMSQRIFPNRQTWVPPPREEPFMPDEVGPGDIDYEYTMCLMQCCPCLRPSAQRPSSESENPEFGKLPRDNWNDPWADKIEDPEVAGEGYSTGGGYNSSAGGTYPGAYSTHLGTMAEGEEVPDIEV